MPAEHDAKVGAPQRESHGVLPRVARTSVELGAPEGLRFEIPVSPGKDLETINAPAL